MCFVKYLTVTFSVDLPVEINYLVSACQARLQQFRVTDRCSGEGSNKHNDRGAL